MKSGRSLYILLAALAFVSLIIGGKLGTQQYVPYFLAIFIGILTPIIIIAIRHQVRLQRIRLIELFAENFLPGSASKTNLDDAPSKTLVSFEFTRGKYFVDLDPAAKSNPALIPKAPFALATDWLLLLSALPFMIFSALASFILFSPDGDFCISPNACALAEFLRPSLFLTGYFPVETFATDLNGLHKQSLVIAGAAFVGGYFFCLHKLLRAVACFDLSSITFLRAFAHILSASVLVVIIWQSSVAIGLGTAAEKARDVILLPACQLLIDCNPTATGKETSNGVAAAPPAPSTAQNPDQQSQAGAEPTSPQADASPATADAKPAPPAITSNGKTTPEAGWVILAFVFGFVPDAALSWLLHKSGLNFKMRLKTYDALTPIVPTTLLDGIDFFIAFRLEEANIFDVQNLATANPIMLHIETPYGIYETIDWVAQAQLCTVVGPEKYKQLRLLHIRTIFDLEIAFWGAKTSPTLQRLIATILLAEDDSTALANRLTGMKLDREATIRKLLTCQKPPASPAADASGSTAPESPACAAELDLGAHLVRIILDDLHVRRLREIWNSIGDSLGPMSDRIRQPGDRYRGSSR